jgi:hypothetical protein
MSIGGSLSVAENLFLAQPHLFGWHGVNPKQQLGVANARAEFHFCIGKSGMLYRVWYFSHSM